MTGTQDDTIAELQRTVAELRQQLGERDAALAQRKTDFDERIEHQVATIDVLKVMSASPGDAQPVFDLIVDRARDLCDAYGATVFEFDGTGIHWRAATGVSDDPAVRAAYEAQFPMVPTWGWAFGRAILDRRIIRIDDMEAEPGLDPTLRGITAKSNVTIPIMRGDEVIGAIGMGSREKGGFSDSQVELLKTFAEQAVIAITSAETYRALQTRTSDLQQSLEYQTATSDVLKVISGSNFALEPVFQTVVDTAVRLCHADQAVIFRLQDDAFRWAAGTELVPEYERRLRKSAIRPGTGTLIGRVALQGRPVHILDLWTDPLYERKDDARIGGVHTNLGVPLVRDGATIGVIGLGRIRIEPFTDRQIELVSTFADQAVIAIENTRLITEQREALEQQTATAEVLQVINSSPGNLTPVFEAMLEKAIRLCGGDRGVLWTIEGGRGRLAAARGLPVEFVALLRERGESGTNSPLQRVVQGEWLIEFPDTVEEFSRSGDPHAKGAVEAGVRSAIWVAIVKEGVAVGAFAIGRSVIGTFSDKQIALLQNFAAQAVIAMENARLITETRDALEQQTATAEVLQVINSSPGDLVPVFDAMLEKAMRLCGGTIGGIFTFEGDHSMTAALRGVTAAFREYNDKYPMDKIQPGTVPARIIETRSPVQNPDLTAGENYHAGHPYARAIVELGGIRAVLAVPLLKDGVAIGMVAIYREEPGTFSDKQIALLENFADQAVIAMENARLINETHEALEQQTATAEVLQVINASPGDLVPVFATMLERAMRLCDAAFGSLLIYDGERLRAAALRSVPEEFASFLREPIVPEPGTALAQVIDARRIVHWDDARTQDAYLNRAPLAVAGVEGGGVRTLIGVPLVKDGNLLGILHLYRQEVRPFSDKHVALLQNFAAQAVIAMENARLINEQREALEQQTATAEVLQVINASPGNLTPVFETILDKAHNLCDVAIGSLVTYDGEFMHVEVTHGLPQAVAGMVRPPFHPNPNHQALVDGARFVHIPDLKVDAASLGHDLTRRSIVTADIHTSLYVPLRNDRGLLGFISAFRKDIRPFAGTEIALLENFAAQAVIAMENARLLDEIRQRQEELRITFENMGDGVAMFNETQHLVAWNRKFQDILDVPDDIIARRQTFSEYVRYLAERGEFGAGADPEQQIHRLTENIDQYRAFERVRPNGRVIEVRHNPVPGGGFVLIYADITERKHNEAEIRAARDAAEEASRTIEAAYRELKTAQANLIQAEKMASLGQLTAGIAHEIKNPLNFVNNFSALSAELIDELRDVLAPEPLGETARTEVDDLTALLKGNLEKVVQHGQRADGIVRSMLDHSRGSSGERRMVDLNALIDEALNLAYHGARAQDQSFNITLERDFGAGIAPIEVNPQDITRVFLNVFSNGFYAATTRARDGGGAGFVPTLKVTTSDAGEAVEIRVRDNGTGIPADIRDKLFQPFFTTKPTGEGTGLGLSITYDIVTQQHGGSITVDSEVGEYSEFTIRLPRNP